VTASSSTGQSKPLDSSSVKGQSRASSFPPQRSRLRRHLAARSATSGQSLRICRLQRHFLDNSRCIRLCCSQPPGDFENLRPPFFVCHMADRRLITATTANSDDPGTLILTGLANAITLLARKVASLGQRKRARSVASSRCSLTHRAVSVNGDTRTTFAAGRCLIMQYCSGPSQG
jgi:hypothetical protein